MQSWPLTEQSLHSFIAKPCQELQSGAVICEHRPRVAPELRDTTLTDRTVNRIQEKLTAELRFATRRDKDSWSKRFREETDTHQLREKVIQPLYFSTEEILCHLSDLILNLLARDLFYLFISCCSICLLFG